MSPVAIAKMSVDPAPHCSEAKPKGAITRDADRGAMAKDARRRAALHPTDFCCVCWAVSLGPRRSFSSCELEMPSLLYARRRYSRTVEGLMPSFSAHSFDVRPCAVNSTAESSRAVKVLMPGAPYANLLAASLLACWVFSKDMLL